MNAPTETPREVAAELAPETETGRRNREEAQRARIHEEVRPGRAEPGVAEPNVLLLPAGVTRRVKVDAGELTNPHARHFLVFEERGGLRGDGWSVWEASGVKAESGAFEVRVGIAFDPLCGYSRVQAWVETDAALVLTDAEVL